MCLFIKRQVLILAEEGKQQELINSNLVVFPEFFRCQLLGCVQHSKSLGNHKSVKPVFLLQLYILYESRFLWLEARCDIQWWEGGGGPHWPSVKAWHCQLLGQLSGVTLLGKQPFIFHSPRARGQQFLGSLPMSVKYRNVRMCWRRFQSRQILWSWYLVGCPALHFINPSPGSP